MSIFACAAEIMRRRNFIGLLSGATAWSFIARAEENKRVRRIGVLMTLAADDPESQLRMTAFAQGLEELGCSVGHNIQIDYRFGAGDAERLRKYAAELVALAPTSS